MATLNYAIPDIQPSFYSNQQPSPTNSSSPTSPRMTEFIQPQGPNPYKQIRPLKQALYIPAALRPTEHFSSPGAMTPPKSLHGSQDSLQDGELGEPLAPREDEIALALETHWMQSEELGNVDGPPTRDHWKPDEASPSCDSPQCRSTFNIFVRKHHCRHCGHIFCATHANHTIPLDQDAKFHPDGHTSRACETCYNHYQRWDTARSIRRKNSQNSKDDENSASGPATPLAGRPGHLRMMSSGMQRKPPQEIASSVPKDWSWGTF